MTPTEVRAFLHDLSEVFGRLQRGEAHQLDRAERAEARAQLAEQLDEHRLVELLGAETARVLEAAREAAGDIRGKAEESAARMVRDAQGEAHAIVEQAERDGAARNARSCPRPSSCAMTPRRSSSGGGPRARSWSTRCGARRRGRARAHAGRRRAGAGGGRGRRRTAAGHGP